MEKRLKLRALLSRRKAELFGKSRIFANKEEIYIQEKRKAKKKILEKLKKENEMEVGLTQILEKKKEVN